MSYKSSYYDSKIYFKTKIADNGEPYFVGQTTQTNTASKEDIVKVVNDHISNKVVANKLIDELLSYIMPTGHQIRMTWRPTLFKECIGESDYKTFVKWCKKMALSTIDIKEDDGSDKEHVISMFSLYSYYNKPTK